MITTKKEIKLLDFSSINMDIDFSRLKNELQLYKKKYLIYSKRENFLKELLSDEFSISLFINKDRDLKTSLNREFMNSSYFIFERKYQIGKQNSISKYLNNELEIDDLIEQLNIELIRKLNNEITKINKSILFSNVNYLELYNKYLWLIYISNVEPLYEVLISKVLTGRKYVEDYTYIYPVLMDRFDFYDVSQVKDISFFEGKKSEDLEKIIDMFFKEDYTKIRTICDVFWYIILYAIYYNSIPKEALDYILYEEGDSAFTEFILSLNNYSLNKMQDFLSLSNYTLDIKKPLLFKTKISQLPLIKGKDFGKFIHFSLGTFGKFYGSFIAINNDLLNVAEFIIRGNVVVFDEGYNYNHYTREEISQLFLENSIVLAEINDITKEEFEKILNTNIIYKTDK